jgi:hypothetical protein
MLRRGILTEDVLNVKYGELAEIKPFVIFSLSLFNKKKRILQEHCCHVI